MPFYSEITTNQHTHCRIYNISRIEDGTFTPLYPLQCTCALNWATSLGTLKPRHCRSTYLKVQFSGNLTKLPRSESGDAALAMRTWLYALHQNGFFLNWIDKINVKYKISTVSPYRRGVWQSYTIPGQLVRRRKCTHVSEPILENVGALLRMFFFSI